MKFPLSITTFREDLGFGIFGTGGQILLPSTMPFVTFTRDSIQYRLRLVGFGLVETPGEITPVSSLEASYNTEIFALADLFGVVEPACVGSPNTKPILAQVKDFGKCGPESTGVKKPQWGEFGKKDVLEFDSGDTLTVACEYNPRINAIGFQMFYTAAGSTERRPGRQPALGMRL
jgi:hypothetical protein